MKEKVKCYLAGHFGLFGKYEDWRDFVIERCRNKIEFYDPRFDTKQGSIATFVSEDLKGVENSDIVFYFVTGPGEVGAAIECAVGLCKEKLIVLCIDEGVGMVHPFLLCIARRVFIGIETGVEYLEKVAQYGLNNEYRAAYDILKSNK